MMFLSYLILKGTRKNWRKMQGRDRGKKKKSTWEQKKKAGRRRNEVVLGGRGSKTSKCVSGRTIFWA